MTVFRGGSVLTADPAHPRASAVAVSDGRIVAVDHVDTVDTDVDRFDGATVEVVDLAGRCLVPGFRDGHLHPLWGGTDLAAAPVSGATTVADLQSRLREWAEANPDREWITGGGYDPTLVPDGNGDARWLDEAVPDRPVLLRASDYHTAWANTAALELAGITRDTPDPRRGTIVRRADGTPLGALLEAAADLVSELVPPPTREERAEGLRRALAEMASSGIVWGQEAALDPEDVAVYLAVAAEGGLTARVNVALRADPGKWPNQRSAFAAARANAMPGDSERDVGRDQPDLVTVGTVKFFADGIIEAGTAALLEPYEDAPHSCGLPNWSPGELAEAVATFDRDGFQIHIHAIGDGGIRAALGAIEHAILRNGPRDRRPVIAHTQLVHPDDLGRFATLGVIANFEPLWARLDPIMVELTEPRLGKERSALQYPIAGLARRGATVGFGSDWPVSSMNPLEGMSVAMTRQTADGVPPEGWLPEHKVSLDEALHAYTAAGAYQAFTEHDTGTIAVGRRADLCLLEADISALPPLDVASVSVAGTWLGGVEVYRT